MYTHTYIHTSMYLYICVYCVYIYIYLSIYLSKGLKKRVLLRALPGISSYDRYFHLYILLCLHLNTYIYIIIYLYLYGVPWRSVGNMLGSLVSHMAFHGGLWEGKNTSNQKFFFGGQFFAVQRSSGT